MTIVTRDGEEGKFCPKCKEWQPLSEFSRQPFSRDGYQWWCKACIRWNSQRYYIKHREKMQRFREENRQRRNGQMRAYRQANLEEMRRRDQKRYENNRERILTQRQKYYRKHTEKVQKRHRQWWDENQDKVSAARQRRRARTQAADGLFTETEWSSLKAYHNYNCLCCGRCEPEIRLTPDHVVPLSKGGSNDIANIQPLCDSCNKSKSTKTTDYRPRFAASRSKA